jgi:transcription elongation factor GreA-like protein
LNPQVANKGGVKMIVKRGSVVSHTVALEWGIGKVTEVNDVRATIQFNDGMIRKITSSHFMSLQPADPASYLPPSEKTPVAKVKAVRAAAPKKPKKLKEAVV